MQNDSVSLSLSSSLVSNLSGMNDIHRTTEKKRETGQSIADRNQFMKDEQIQRYTYTFGIIDIDI
jgi:hypothetical protein